MPDRMLEPSWTSTDAWLRLSLGVLIPSGVRCFTATICPRCLLPIRRVDEERSLARYCPCGSWSSHSDDTSAHGLPALRNIQPNSNRVTDGGTR